MGQVDENPEVAATYDTTDDDGFVLNQAKPGSRPAAMGSPHEPPRVPHEYPMSTHEYPAAHTRYSVLYEAKAGESPAAHSPRA